MCKIRRHRKVAAAFGKTCHHLCRPAIRVQQKATCWQSCLAQHILQQSKSPQAMHGQCPTFPRCPIKLPAKALHLRRHIRFRDPTIQPSFPHDGLRKSPQPLLQHASPVFRPTLHIPRMQPKSRPHPVVCPRQRRHLCPVFFTRPIHHHLTHTRMGQCLNKRVAPGIQPLVLQVIVSVKQVHFQNRTTNLQGLSKRTTTRRGVSPIPSPG